LEQERETMKIEHQVQEPQRPVWQVLLVVVILVLAVNAVVVWINRMPGGYGGLAGMLLIILLIFYSSRLMNRKLARYTYRWDGRELAVERKLGRRSKPLIEIPGDQIDWVRPFDEMKSQLLKMKRARKTMAYACRLEGEGVYMLQFHEGKRIYRMVFQPGEPLAKALIKVTREQGR
jgi:hypothetical protein